jgi:hypothetical protein
MARYILITSVWATPPSCPSGHKYGTGQTLADTIGNALPGDVVLSQFTTVPNPANVRPIDAAASAIMGLPITTLQALVISNPGGTGAGADVGN